MRNLMFYQVEGDGIDPRGVTPKNLILIVFSLNPVINTPPALKVMKQLIAYCYSILRPPL